ncbi:MAG: hypothetical protein CBC34_002795 [Hyphomicrobiaceae bacterium TMED74]|nr:hypothetical protein [Filomicrobium sp.]RPG46610.1 MAG: hypothetical protein CBC34_002795 [Hyphomicrobiaceae bacterium TMED74]
MITRIGEPLTNLFFTRATLDWIAGSQGFPFPMAMLVNGWPLRITLGRMAISLLAQIDLIVVAQTKQVEQSG